LPAVTQFDLVLAVATDRQTAYSREVDDRGAVNPQETRLQQIVLEI
jgi:hypothetical protein